MPITLEPGEEKILEQPDGAFLKARLVVEPLSRRDLRERLRALKSEREYLQAALGQNPPGKEELLAWARENHPFFRERGDAEVRLAAVQAEIDRLRGVLKEEREA